MLNTDITTFRDLVKEMPQLNVLEIILPNN